jgi:hypothetical protein
MLADHFRRRAGEMRDLVAHALPVLVEPPAKRQQPAEAAFDHHDPRRAGSELENLLMKARQDTARFCCGV